MSDEIPLTWFLYFAAASFSIGLLGVLLRRNAIAVLMAIVAYRQPVTRAAIDRIRGVDSDYTVRTLLHRRLVAELGRRDTPGRPVLFGTTFTFLERFGLISLDELPPLSTDAAQLTALTDPAVAANGD